MKVLFSTLLVLTVAVTAAADCQICPTNKWAVCSGTDTSASCTCPLTISENVTITVNCGALTRKCFMMKTEMYRKRTGQSTRRKPNEHAIIDNDGIYDPECESTGVFKAKQCNNTQECWCVNTAGVRRTDKKDQSLVCSELVKTWWIRIDLEHDKLSQVNDQKLFQTINNTITQRYYMNGAYVQAIMREDDDTVTIDLHQNASDSQTDLATVAYYLEKDVKNSSLFATNKNLVMADGTTLPLKNVYIYFIDEKAPEFTMKRLTGGIIAVIVVVVLAVAAIIVLIITGKKSRKYKKAEGKEMDEMQKQQLTSS